MHGHGRYQQGLIATLILITVDGDRFHEGLNYG